MSWLPPEEDTPVPRQEKKYVNKHERWERFEQGIWTDAYGKTYELCEMHEKHIINVLEQLWTNANDEAVQRFERLIWDLSEEKGCLIPRDDPFLDQFLDNCDTEKIWHEHPFVTLALQELEKREYDYIRPYDERRLPF